MQVWNRESEGSWRGQEARPDLQKQGDRSRSPIGRRGGDRSLQERERSCGEQARCPGAGDRRGGRVKSPGDLQVTQGL